VCVLARDIGVMPPLAFCVVARRPSAKLASRTGCLFARKLIRQRFIDGAGNWLRLALQWQRLLEAFLGGTTSSLMARSLAHTLDSEDDWHR